MEAREAVLLNASGPVAMGLQVSFAWREDRHLHTISLLVGDGATPVLESIEGTSVEPWPSSPPLQQLSVEELRPQTQVALLVGMAGKSHWSMSVEPTSNGFVFDVACRWRGEAGTLGSGYRLLDATLDTLASSEATINRMGQLIRIRADSEGATAANLKPSPAGLRIEPAVIVPGTTTRWRYTIDAG